MKRPCIGLGGGTFSLRGTETHSSGNADLGESGRWPRQPRTEPALGNIETQLTAFLLVMPVSVHPATDTTQSPVGIHPQKDPIQMNAG